jgi:phenylacetate-CoA ligase
MNQSYYLQTLGSKQKAKQVAARVQKLVPAYRDFLQSQGIEIGIDWDKLPLTDKKSYLMAYKYPELLGNDTDQILAFFRSSGSSGNPFYWSYLKSGSRWAPLGSRLFLEKAFAIHQRKTLAIVALDFGSWITGDHFSWALKSMALRSPYPFSVATPGNALGDVIQLIEVTESLFEQIIILIVPSAIAHLHLKAKQLGKTLPLDKIKYIVLSESFPESLRTYHQRKARVPETTPFMFSMYGSTDTGGLGVESLATICLRKLLFSNPALAAEIGIELPIPLFFHYIYPDAFLEAIDGNLYVTRWQGIPLVRYQISDKVNFYHWKKLKAAIVSSQNLQPADEPLVKKIASASNWLPNLIAVTGRTDNCLVFGGTNLTEYVLDAAVTSADLQPLLTGLYQARIIYEEDKQFLSLNLETHLNIEINSELENTVYYALIKSLNEIEPLFASDYKNLYFHWDNEPTQRVLKLNFLPYPALSQATEHQIKQRGIIL